MATLDLITLADAKAQIGATTGADDGTIAGYVSACSQLIDRMCGPIVIRTVTGETHATTVCDRVRLDYWPVYSISSVVEYASDGTSTTLTADTVSSKAAAGYWRFPKTNVIERRAGGVRYQFPYAGNVVVSYVAGRYATTATVDDLFKQACRMLFANVWRFERGTGNQTFGDGVTLPGFGVPNAVKELLRAEMLPPGVA